MTGPFSNPRDRAMLYRVCGACLVLTAAAWWYTGRPKPKPLPPPLWDVPSLFGLNIDQVTAKLGPTGDREFVLPGGGPDADENEKVYHVGPSDELDVSFHSRTRQVMDFTIGCGDPSGLSNDVDGILHKGNLTRNDPRYTIQLGHSQNWPAGYYPAITVVPH